jgi:hypothetical protein
MRLISYSARSRWRAARVRASRWVSVSYWRFLLRGCTSWRQFRCRDRGHAPRYHNGSPDWICVNCGDYLGE